MATNHYQQPSPTVPWPARCLASDYSKQLISAAAFSPSYIVVGAEGKDGWDPGCSE